MRRRVSSMETIRSRTTMPLAKVTVRTSPSSRQPVSTPGNALSAAPAARSSAQVRSASVGSVTSLVTVAMSCPSCSALACEIVSVRPRQTRLGKTAMTTPAPALSVPSIRMLAEGAGWRVAEVTCRAGSQDRAYQEQHGWTCIAAVLEGTFQYRAASGQALMTPGSLLLGNAGACFECGHPHSRGDRCVAFHLSPDFIADTAGALRGVT